jgi:hypothetical protein
VESRVPICKWSSIRVLSGLTLRLTQRNPAPGNFAAKGIWNEKGTPCHPAWRYVGVRVCL